MNHYYYLVNGKYYLASSLNKNNKDEDFTLNHLTGD